MDLSLAPELLAKLVDAAIDGVKSLIVERFKAKQSTSGGQLGITTRRSATSRDVANALANHLRWVERWSATVSFMDLRDPETGEPAKSVRLEQIYVELDTYMMPVRTHQSPLERDHRVQLLKALRDGPGHAVVLGQPGAGKTTAMKKVCRDFFAKDKVLLNYNFPIVILLRDLKFPAQHRRGEEAPNVFLQALIEILPPAVELHATNERAETRDTITQVAAEAFLRYLDELRPLVIVDGFDEIPTQQAKEAVLRELRALTSSLTRTKVVITCRSGEFDYNLRNTSHFEICELTTPQIRACVGKWLKNPESTRLFLDGLARSPFADTAIKPLSLAHLCAIYQRTGEIPERPKEVYRKILYLLLEEWNEQQSLKRESKFPSFGTETKRDFLCNLAHVLAAKDGRAVFERLDIISSYDQLWKRFKLPQNGAMDVISEIETHTGLFVAAGYHRYEFVHKSLQEYLVAMYLHGLPSIPIEFIKKEHLQPSLAVAAAMSPDATRYLTELLLLMVTSPAKRAVPAALLSRLKQEKPELYASDAGTLALFCFAAALRLAPTSIECLREMIEKDGWTIVMRHYDVADRIDDAVSLLLARRHEELQLPERMTASQELFLLFQ